MFQFAWPWVFVVLPLPLVVYLYLFPSKTQRPTVVVPFFYSLKKAGQSSTIDQQKAHYLALLLLVLIWVLMVSSAARPQWVGDAVGLSSSGRDLLLAVDISDSMDQPDMVLEGQNATRLQAVKAVVADFIERRQGDRIGLVLFGTNAYLQSPLTFDTKTVARFLEEAQLGFAGPKTAIGDAIGLSVKRLQELGSNNTDRVMVLLTDGANTAGEVEPLRAASLAQQTDVKVYTIGIGAEEMTIRGFFGARRINPSAQLDEKTLISIAETTGGRYFRARETQELSNIYSELDKLEPVAQEQQWLRPTRALFMWPLAIAALLSIVLVFTRLAAVTMSRESQWNS